MESYTLVKFCHFDYASVTEMTSNQRHRYMEMFALEQEAKAEAMKQSANKSRGGR